MRRILLAVVLMLSGLALAAPASAAAPAPTVRLVSSTIVAGGAAVDFRYTVNCGVAAGRFSLYEEVLQEVGERTTGAHGNQFLDCTGRAQDVAVRTWYAFTYAVVPGPATHKLSADFLLPGGNLQTSLEGAVTLRDGAPRNTISAAGVPTLFFYGDSVDTAHNTITLTAVWKCDSSLAKGAGITVAQVVDGRVPLGNAGFEYECTGQWETTRLVFEGQPGALPLRAGAVSVTSQFAWCGNDENGEFSCTDRYLSDTVTVA
ncbi:hypothetical protein Aab01nite_61790 [Paractinoplanes abujensis]|uniref:Secreted protein n=1 Tax=Paractinoplanes abujensis TaxID=882441 RepID=A0A7W7CQL0_9ACTN|nr:hypothetical protein [Actinoplanes abujensis]MBB4692911.1 hypothetical protein [Actinoplanes abujensis]GID22589.1 hypothetical protein Aab01nite_61790 [Actinoplanes abujensis]